MKMKLTALLPIALLIGLMGCQQVSTEDANSSTAATNNTKVEMSPKEQEVVNQMLWVQSADAKADANKSLSADGKPELIAFSGRGISFPGLSSSQYEDIKDSVTYRNAMGSGDVLFGPTHKALRSQLSDYASVYNTTIHMALLEKR